MPIVYNNKYQRPFLFMSDLNNQFLVRFSFENNINADFYDITYDQLGELSNLKSSHHYIDVKSSLNNIVWFRGSDQYKYRLNYNYIDQYLFEPQESSILKDKNFMTMELFLSQGFNWNNKYGLHIIVKGNNTQNIYVSKIVKISDFNISDSKLLNNGKFWIERNLTKLLINNSEDLSVYITELDIDDVSIDPTNLGYISKITNNFQPVTKEEISPDFIVVDVSIDQAGYLNINPKTLEFKTLETSIKNYFNYDADKIVPISIEYVITLFDNQSTRKFRISNEDNNFESLKFGLNFDEFIDINDPSKVFDIYVDMYISIDGNMMTRSNHITTNFSTQIVNMVNSFQQPDNIIFTNVEEITQIQQTVINKDVDTKIVQIYQPVFVEYVTKNFKYENKNITLTNLNQPAYMIVSNKESTFLNSKYTSDNKYYFDLSELPPIQKDTVYELFLIENDKKIGQGLITIE